MYGACEKKLLCESCGFLGELTDAFRAQRPPGKLPLNQRRDASEHQLRVKPGLPREHHLAQPQLAPMVSDTTDPGNASVIATLSEPKKYGIERGIPTFITTSSLRAPIAPKAQQHRERRAGYCLPENGAGSERVRARSVGQWFWRR